MHQFLLSLCLASSLQSPRLANPERPTFATHAYAVAPGYAELEQGIAARGVESLREATIYTFNLKFGLSHRVQFAVSGPLYNRTGQGSGIGDLGGTLKFRSDLSSHVATAVAFSVTAPTGNAAEALGAGRALGSMTAVVSADLPLGVHVDANTGPQAIGSGASQWFFAVAGSRGLGRAGLTLEFFRLSGQVGGKPYAGFLGAVTFRLAEWAVADAGGVDRTAPGTPDELFVGITTNLGRIL